jgi:predicted AAA+ superfamily ATPase
MSNSTAQICAVLLRKFEKTAAIVLWILNFCRDVIKRDKSEHYLREILGAIIKHYSSQISWRDLVKAMSIDHTHTAIDYVALLEAMDAVFVQAALIEDKLVAAPKKARKFMFNDPFIYHAIYAWLNPTKNPYRDQIQTTINNPILCGKLVESCVITHFRRYYEKTFYIKAEGEVDLAYIEAKAFKPIEIKWTKQLHPKDLKQVLKYKNAQIWAQVYSPGTLENTPILPLPWALFNLDNIIQNRRED